MVLPPGWAQPETRAERDRTTRTLVGPRMYPCCYTHSRAGRARGEGGERER